MKNLCYILLSFCPFILSAQELIQNPEMNLVIDEQKAEKVFAELGLNRSFVLAQSTNPKDIENLKEAIQKTFEFDYFTVGGWEYFTDKRSEGVEIVHLPTTNKAKFLFHLQEKTQYITTEFKPLKKGQVYRIQIATNFNAIPTKPIRPIGIFLTRVKEGWEKKSSLLSI